MIEISGSLIWSKTLIELIFNPCGEFWLKLVSLGSLKTFKICSDTKERVGAESNGKLPHLYNA